VRPVLTILVVGACLMARDASAQRVRVTVDGPWRYAPGPIEGAESVGFDDRAWAVVRVPHTWNAVDVFDKGRGYRRGDGWYRTTLMFDSAYAGKRISLEFAGANQTADVYLNGQLKGHHVGGYTAFTVDITGAVQLGAPNLLAVRVNNSRDPDVPPLSADYTFYGGLYRQVWLVATDSVHVEDVAIDLRDMSAKKPTVHVRGTVVGTAGGADVVSHLVDDGGHRLGDSVVTRVASGGGGAFEQLIGPVDKFKLWSPEHPTLYHVITEVRAGGQLRDRRTTPVGFRWFSVDAEHGFMLNGHPYPLRGVNRHQDRAGFANALPEWANRDDIQRIVETGFNFVRLAHYPQDEAVLDEADRLGLLVWEEIPVVNEVPASPAFADNAERMLVEMIHQHRNHPSIVFWGFMNEVTQRVPMPLPAGYGARIAALGRRLNTRAHAEDPTRLTAIALATKQIDDGSGLQDVPDVVGINCYFGWYYSTIDSLGPFLDAFHARNPTRPVLISEYGAAIDERIHAVGPPHVFDMSEEYAAKYHEGAFAQIADRKWLVGSAVWSAFDFGSKDRDDSKPNLNNKGLYTFDRRAKDLASFYRARTGDADIVYIASRDWQTRIGYTKQDRLQPIVIYTNADRIEIAVNDGSPSLHGANDGVVRLDVRLEPGVNDIAVSGRGPNGSIASDEMALYYVDRGGFFTDPLSPIRSIAVHPGSTTYMDSSGMVWGPDDIFADGGRIVTGHHRIVGTNEDPLYQTTREGVAGYRFPVPDGEYEVQLLMTEQVHDGSGERIVDIDVNDTPLATRLDLADQYGPFTAVERTARVSAVGGRGIEVRFLAHAGETTISGIRITRL
jgi:beta-galactosidase